ncbi:MFS transporter [Bacillus massiliigorillae]|uniref:MFS transporter n=1 Tax=Bacillus massiliigorillae TaxID=1243664 RepID=UPI00039AE804|nr:aromatic acid/H+ symport family MFS transporter [Bacillus massiliigorillae]
MKPTNINDVILNLKFNRFHLQILLCCIFIIICDGYDMFVLGAILPSLMEDLNITALQGGMLSSYALIGMMLGALIFGPTADKIGRKKVIVICTIIFSLLTFTSGFASSMFSFGFQRFLAGVGLGGVMPNLIAIITEYSPKKLRSTLVAVMFSGHAMGGIVAAVGAMYLLPTEYSWRAVLWLGLIPLILMPILYKLLPESLAFYVLKGQKNKLVSVLNKLDKSRVYDTNQEYVLGEEDKKSEDYNKSPIKKLFLNKRGLSTFMFWIAYFMCLLVMYGLSTWLPKIMGNAGYEMGSSLAFLIVLNVGAVIGAIGGGQLADKLGSRKVLVVFFIIAFISLISLSFKPNMVLLYILIALAGGTTTGTQIVMNAYVSQYYPTEIRSTGVGWALGIGRIGGIIGPTLGGMLLNAQLSLQINFIAFAIPCIIAGLAIWFVQDKFSQLTIEKNQVA